MTSMLLASKVWNYVLIAVVVLLLFAYPVLMNSRNKKETQKVQEQTNSLKVGDKVLTTSGVYGTIVELNFDDTKKAVVIETGGKVKSYMTVDAYAIYTVFKSDAELQREAEAKAAAEQAAQAEVQAQKETKKSSKKNATVEEQVAEVVAPEQPAEKAPAKKTATKKTTKK